MYGPLIEQKDEDGELVLSKKQAESLFAAKARFNIWVGAVRSGKSYASLICFEDFCKNGPPGDFVIIGKSLKTIRMNVISPLRDMLGDRLQVSYGRGEAMLYNRII